MLNELYEKKFYKKGELFAASLCCLQVVKFKNTTFLRQALIANCSELIQMLHKSSLLFFKPFVFQLLAARKKTVSREIA